MCKATLYNCVIPALIFFSVLSWASGSGYLTPTMGQAFSWKPCFPGPRSWWPQSPSGLQWIKLSVIGHRPHPPMRSIRSLLPELLEAREALCHLSTQHKSALHLQFADGKPQSTGPGSRGTRMLEGAHPPRKGQRSRCRIHGRGPGRCV